MLNSVLDAIERAHSEVDTARDEDWAMLGERLRRSILDASDHIGADFTEAQKEAIIAVCRETYYAASIVAKAYSFKAVEALHRELG